MDGQTESLDQIVRQCRSALTAKYGAGVRHQATPLFEAELDLVRKSGFASALLEAVHFAKQLQQRGWAFHLIGSGCSSMIAYLVGLSEVDPVRYRTRFSRFWTTGNKECPVFQFVVWPCVDEARQEIPIPSGITAHSMTALEAIPALLECRLPNVLSTQNDRATFEAIQGGDTDGVFQLGSENVRRLIAEIRPSRIKELTLVTALDQIGPAHPEVVKQCLEHLRARQAPKQERRQRAKSEAKQGLPFVFQESIMDKLRGDTGLLWADSYRFVQAAAKGQMAPDHELWSQAIEGLKSHRRDLGEEHFFGLATACQWALCRAHHAANAIISYKAAYFRTHHRMAFEEALQQVRNLQKPVGDKNQTFESRLEL